jgi:hypothetical protein
VAVNQCDPVDWVYDIGENSDCSVDAWVADNVRDFIRVVRAHGRREASFATKAVNPDLLRYDPRGGTRVRSSLMPREVSRSWTSARAGRTPETQKPKRSQTGGWNVRYRRGWKAPACASCSR